MVTLDTEKKIKRIGLELTINQAEVLKKAVNLFYKVYKKDVKK